MQGEDGPIDNPKRIEDVKQEPYTLPDRYAHLHATTFALMHQP